MLGSKKQSHIICSVVFFLLVLSLNIMCFSVPIHAAESGSCGNELNWSFSGGHLSITGSGEMTKFTDENMPPWYSSSQEITKVTIGEGVTSIGSLAFYNCSKLKTISLPSTLEMIGARAFKDCTTLPYVGFPSGLKTISEAAFENCASLSGIILPDGLRNIGDYAFYRCYSLTSITIPASVQTFGMVVFAYCENLTQATIECSIVKIPDWTFYGCKNLSVVVLPETISSAGEYAFHDCGKLETIHYNGTSGDELMSDIKKDDNGISSTGGITTDEHDGAGSNTSSIIEEDGSSATTVITSVKETENSLIIKDVDTTNTYLIDGESATIPEIVEADENANVDIESKSTVTITSTVNNSDGWTGLAEEVSDALGKRSDIEKAEVVVYVSDSTIFGSDLAKFAGKDVILNLTTSSGDTWKIDASSISSKKVTDRSYNFAMTITEMKAGKTKIDSDTVFKVEFAEDLDFHITVGIHVGYPYGLATLYEKHFMSYDELQTVVVDADGVAWFSFSNIDKKMDYYVGINVSGKTAYDAVIPTTLYEEYGLVDDEATLTDANGVAYKITGRSSSWGITSNQFAIYMAVIIGGVILIVTLGMFTWNKIQRSKEKYAVNDTYENDGEDDDLELIDEEALRMEIMRELLAESKKKDDKET